ncbi:MAG: hypothetical protein [Caudoviricetes sp.]|nr:MAG: hypothetical protein [Caudoviricetes sp.]
MQNCMLYEVINLVMLFISKPNNQKELFNMVLTLTPEIVTRENKPAKIEIPQPSVTSMKIDIVEVIRQFLVNPQQAAGEKWANERFNTDNLDEYIHAMASGFQDWLCDIYGFEYTSTLAKHIGIYETYSDALKNSIEIFGDYAIEQQVIYIAGALFTVITPTRMCM